MSHPISHDPTDVTYPEDNHSGECEICDGKGFVEVPGVSSAGVTVETLNVPCVCKQI